MKMTVNALVHGAYAAAVLGILAARVLTGCWYKVACP
jgi:hypothetical protein